MEITDGSRRKRRAGNSVLQTVVSLCITGVLAGSHVSIKRAAEVWHEKFRSNKLQAATGRGFIIDVFIFIFYTSHSALITKGNRMR